LAIVIVVFSPLIANKVFSEPRLEPVLRVLALSVPLMALTSIATAATRGSKVMHYDAIVQVVGPAFRIVAWAGGLLLLANLLNAAIYATVSQSLLSALLALFFTYWVFRGYFSEGIEWKFRSLWLYSAPLILSSLMYSMAPRMDRLVLGVVSDAQAVGIYSIAASLMLLLKLTHGSIVKTFLPVVADAYNRRSANRAQALYITVTRWDARLTFVVVIVSLLVAQEVLGLLGESYSEALVPFAILAAAVYIGTIPGPTGAFLQMTNHQRIEALNAAIFFVVSPLVQLAFALWLGWIGVALGVLAMAFVINTVQIVEIRHFYGFHPFQNGHLLFTVLSIVAVIVCAFAGITQPLAFRLVLLAAVLSAFLVFIYSFRTSTDEFLFRMLFGGASFSKLKDDLTQKAAHLKK
jgi:O-antigen/teichoic acid export membrane protein